MKKAEFYLIAAGIIVVAALALLGNAQLFGWAPQAPFPGSPLENASSSGVACTQEAKLCPDGSAVGRTGPDCSFAACPVVTTNWKSYTSNAFGLSFQYPSDWQKSNDVLSVVNPHVFFGNPLNGTSTYHFSVFVLNNSSNLSAQAYVQKLLVDDEAQDASASANGPAPTVTPKFTKQYATMVGASSTPAYELYDVLAFDDNDEQIYVQENKQIIEFVFPMPEANPNLSDPVDNNATVHAILATVSLDPYTWKFCGGIASGQFTCPSGYTCSLDGSYPDAGGHCAKK